MEKLIERKNKNNGLFNSLVKTMLFSGALVVAPYDSVAANKQKDILRIYYMSQGVELASMSTYMGLQACPKGTEQVELKGHILTLFIKSKNRMYKRVTGARDEHGKVYDFLFPTKGTAVSFTCLKDGDKIAEMKVNIKDPTNEIIKAKEDIDTTALRVKMLPTEYVLLNAMDIYARQLQHLIPAKIRKNSTGKKLPTLSVRVVTKGWDLGDGKAAIKVLFLADKEKVQKIDDLLKLQDSELKEMAQKGIIRGQVFCLLEYGYETPAVKTLTFSDEKIRGFLRALQKESNSPKFCSNF